MSSGQSADAAEADAEASLVRCFDGTILPTKLFKSDASGALLFVFGHGLTRSVAELEPRIRAMLKACPAENRPHTAVYDARGHGESTGWQNTGNPHQYHWRSLALDMLVVARTLQETLGLDGPVILGGHSMGSASAIYAALFAPRAVRALVLFNIPTMWEARDVRKDQLMQKATDAATGEKPELREVLHGSAIIFGSQATLVIVDKKADLRKAERQAFATWLPTLSQRN